MSDHPMRRETDNGKFARLNAKLGEYRLVVYIALVVLLALGFRYSTPNQRLTGVENDQALMKQTLLDLGSNMESMTRLQCFNPRYKRSELRLAGINCEGTEERREP